MKHYIERYPEYFEDFDAFLERDDVNQFIGTNQKRFSTFWLEKCKNQKLSFKAKFFNGPVWIAAFFPAGWLAYRKMYKLAGLIFLLDVVSIIAK